jgi:MarR family transcriptional regulator, organic hydroperoxide resistance regulator
MNENKEMLTLDRQLCFAVYAAAHAFNRAYKPLLDKLGITYPQYLVMMVLWERNGMPVKDIGARLALDSGTLSPLLKRLEKSGFITRLRDENDERQVVVSLTDAGRAAQKEAYAYVAPSMGAAIGCAREEADDLRTRLRSLKTSLDGSARAREKALTE